MDLKACTHSLVKTFRKFKEDLVVDLDADGRLTT